MAPDRSGEIGEAMARLVREQPLRDTLRAPVLEEVKQFTWERAAREILAALQEVA
ncbi:MAG: hypothetical protein JJE30_02085 [Desulfuromonadales bacterium]|nr:hypothetical protein [Desulfuromonadales bacterium]